MKMIRLPLLVTTALSLSAVEAARAQDAVAEEHGLDVIVVTAQKRAQDVQDVPIAVTAIDGGTLQANRVVNVTDLSGLAPGFTASIVPGPTRAPSFSMRGAVGNGIVPGSDKQVSVYLDGVYLAASRGQVFDLPDVSGIEVLRGPQGTLFGRNSTAGAVSISTRNPSGEMGVRATATVGNYDQYRFNISVDLPQVGPFSGYVSYLHNERRGDIRNTGAGQVWDRTKSFLPKLAKIERSPAYLGSENSDSWFAALKFESGDFTTVYKYDRLDSEGTPAGTGLVGYSPNGLAGGVLKALIESQSIPVPIAPNGRRPDSVSNGFALRTPLKVQGHSLTSTYQISDDVSLKNIFAYRKTFILGVSPIDGLSALTITPEAIPALSGLFRVPAANLSGLIGSPFAAIATQSQGRSEQISDEFQINYQSDLVTATAGALWFHGKDWTAEELLQNTIQFAPIPRGVFQNINIGRTFNKITSLAAYAQLEFHVNQQIDIIAGGRITRDEKLGTLTTGSNLNNLTVLTFEYKKTKPSYLIGINYEPNDDILVYGKYSTAFVSGGSVVGIPFAPEDARSWEFGIKTELFDRKLRANLALFQAKYKNVQQSQASTTPGAPAYIIEVTGDPNRPAVVGSFITTIGDIRARGFEFDLTAAPVRGLTLGGSLGYTDTDLTRVEPRILASTGGRYELMLRPAWTGGFWVQYDTPSIGNSESYVSLRVDGRWQSDMNLAQNPDDPSYQGFAAAIREVPAYWLFNGRVALKELDLGGVRSEIAVWGKNLTNNHSASYALNLGLIAAANYVPARTYGIDLNIEF